tara:strand:- start:691 stop:1434 length:744 start_codon:yes stop_codon:yes gene_type:complete
MNILTLKIGKKYSAKYVNNLYEGLIRNTTKSFNFYCYTDDTKNLNKNIITVPIANTEKYKLQWHKLDFHNNGFANIESGETCLILDIDWIIINNINEIINHKLLDNQFGCFERWWSNKRNYCKINGGFQMYNMGDTQHLYDTFNIKPDYWQEYFINNGEAEGPVNGEQNFIDMHVSDNRYWFPMKWFAKYSLDEYRKIQSNWHNEVNNEDPYYIDNQFSESIKMIHFSNSNNMIENYKDSWIKKYWI